MSATAPKTAAPPSPFDPDNDRLYRRWRDRKMADYPERLEPLVVEVDDPEHLTAPEHAALLDRCRKANMAIYVSRREDATDRAISHAIGQRFGVSRLDCNWLGDDDGLTSLTVSGDDLRQGYIPYSNRAIQWHTDGYYNSASRQIRALNLHCVSAAAEGGKNRLLDHEVAYILLRDAEPEFIRALMAPDVMTLPARLDENGNVARPEESGPVFSIDRATGDLHMRYTIRKRNIVWKDEPVTRAALAFLKRVLDGELGYVVEGRLESGMGLVSNNVLHDRSAFTDGAGRTRLIYRARYYDRLAGTSVHEVYPELFNS